jgi:2-amino-4-hydroxy-6-hydroxymethyldihydropteridine diphosphokinase/dihydropteroate synthase
MDIIFYEDQNVLERDETLIIPHPRWQERDFVKGPLADLTPIDDANRVPVGLDKYLTAAKRLWNDQGGEKTLRKYSEDASLQCVLPVGSMSTWAWSHQTSVMGILNVTPDSFSDGGKHIHVEHAIQGAIGMAQEGADIIDIGGQSTRPGAQQIDPDEEWARIAPVIKALRQESSLDHIPISVDTFYSRVAKQAVEAGANIVNDVSGGHADSNMYRVVADLGVSYILMHMRGNPRTMQLPENVKYKNICSDIAFSLQQSCDAAVDAGIESWRIVLDPGIGFAKTAQGNIDLVANLPKFRSDLPAPYQNLPILLGPSRKRFLGELIGRESAPANERDWATCAVSAISAMHGTNIIRTHNVRATKDAVMVADGVIKEIKE